MQLLSLMTWTALLASTFAQAPVDKVAFPQAPADNPPCAACVTIVVPPQAVEGIPDGLDGLPVIVDLTLGPADSVSGIVELIRRKGGRAGLLVIDSSAPSHSGRLPPVDLLVVRMSHDGMDEEAGFELKKRLVALRGAFPAARLGVLFASSTAVGTLPSELASYFDFAVSRADVPSASDAVVWRDGGDVANADAALDLTRGSTAESILVRPPVEGLAGTVSDLVRARSAFASHLDVVAPRALTVSEIVARHQAAVARQAARVRSLISSGTLTVTFEAPGFPAPITVSAESVAYSAGSQAEIEMRSVRINGIAFEGAGIPRLPIVEPERVSTPPLAIALTDAYRYELRDTADVEGRRCYVVDFEPLSRRGSFFKGRSWIDAETFGLVRVEARQTGLRGPIVASEQVDEYRREDGNLWLPSRSHVRQLYEGAAHKTPIDRLLVTTNHEIDPPDFEQRRLAARTSSAIMLRDTPSGYRFLRQPTGDAIASPGGAPEAERDTAERSSHIRTVVLGALFDPNISYPLPFAGLSYVDFDLFHTGTQLNGFFGGSYGQLAISVPSLGGTRWQLGGRAFAILTSFNDRSFVDGRERYEANISQRPAHASVWLVRPLTTRVSVKTAYELDYTRYRANDTTAQTFTVPADQVVHGFRASIEAQRGGWRASAYWNPALRVGWRPWGAVDSGEYREEQHDFQRVGVSLVRVAVLSPALVVRGEGSWMAGRDLDRFSRMAFDAFENRLRGFPAALIRYDRGAVLRGSAAWSLGSRMRLDGFVDSAFVHDPGLGNGLTRLTGLGSALEVPAPFGMLFAAEWGYGIQGRRADGRQGTHVVRIAGYKVF